jgi:predicted Holliday junction resolvase-like endonuclease
MVDQNLVIVVLLGALFLLLLLMVLLKPAYLRSVRTKDMKEEIKEKKMNAEIAERLAKKYEKKGRL